MSPDYIFNQLKTAFEQMKMLPPSRELNHAMTQLEDAIMWFNKDRTIKGELIPTATFISK